MSRATSPAKSSREFAHTLVPVLRAISDESRLAILVTLARETRTVVELTEELAIAQPLMSHHLKALREVGLVSVTAEGRSNRYAICCDAVTEPIRLLSGLASASPKN